MSSSARSEQGSEFAAEDTAIYAVGKIISSNRRGEGRVCLWSLKEVQAVGGDVDKVANGLDIWWWYSDCESA